MLRTLSCALACALVLPACGDDDLTEEEAQQGFAAAFGVSLTGQLSITSTSADEESATVACLGGGSATLTGTSDEDGTVFNFSIRYDDCVADGITINGTITYAGSSSTVGETDNVMFTMTGTLDFSGEVEGECVVDIEWESTVTDTNASFDFSGSICGYDANDRVFTGF
ncbi:MAG: hypothetical protein AAFU77_02145 [Myxococcota bacterium]